MDGKKKKETKNKKISLSTVLVIAAVIGILLSLWHLLPDWHSRVKAQAQYGELKDEMVKVADGEDGKEKKKDWWSKDVNVDFEKLKAENPDVVGWIRFDNPEQIDISYPILYSGDNEKYVRSDIHGEYLISGCIFLEGLNHPDFSDLYSILYGHNMRDGSMFGSLKKYREEGFCEANPYFTVYTEDTAYRYRIFSWFDAKNGGEVYRIGYEENEEYGDFIAALLECAERDTGVHPDKSDRILTLSTCTETGTYSSRFTVQAVCVDSQTTDSGKLADE